MFRVIIKLAKKYFILTAFLLAIQTVSAQKKATDYVNVFTGTSNSRWMLFPGPTQPFGMVKLSPDNQDNVWNGGYEYTIGSISGFSCLHGMSLAGISYMPVVGDMISGGEIPKLFPGPPDGPFGGMWTSGYRSRFDRKTEKAKPAYYSVHLLDYNEEVELTATERCGLIRTTFPQSDQSHFLLDFDPPTEELNKIIGVKFNKVDDQTIEGSITTSNGYSGEITVYFTTRFSKSIKSIDDWQYEPYTGNSDSYGTTWRRKCDIKKNIDSFEGAAKSGVLINFVTNKGEKITEATGISFVSLKNSALNLKTEVQPFHYDFDLVEAASQKQWNKLLSTVTLKGSEQNKAKFYTDFYRSFTAKNLMSDVNGQYMNMNGKVRTLMPPADGVYSSDALWGTQWNLAPFWTLLTPSYANSMVNSLLAIQKDGGWIPEAPVALKYSPIMGGQHQNSLIIGTYLNGISQFNPDSVFQMIKHDYTTPGTDYPGGGYAGDRQMKGYMKYGYVPDEDGPASNTMEYAYDDWSLGQFALVLKKKSDAQFFLNRSENYKNIFDKNTGYVRRKHQDGTWVEPFDPLKYGTTGGWNGPGFMEGNAWVYTWFVPQDLPELVKMLGKDTFNQRLEEGFKKGYVDLSNEPNLQAPFLFNYSGKPWLTQKYSRMVANDFYNTSQLTGWVGEEDEGQMSSFYCLISMGLFDMTGGCAAQPYYDLSSPVFDEVTIHMDPKYYSGKTFVIRTINNKPGNDYIQSISLNGKKIYQPRIDHKDVVNGGELIIELGKEPNKDYWKK
jgi:predicted alpha-1,2-mannosidase